VALKIFRYVEINGLPVGHTHEDIDRKFADLSRALYQHSAKTLIDLKVITTKKPQPKNHNNKTTTTTTTKTQQQKHTQPKTYVKNT